MSGTRCEAIHWMLPLFACSATLGMLMPVLERPILYFLTIMATGSHWHYGAVVVQQLCKHFGRICFGVEKVEPIRQDMHEEEEVKKKTDSNKEHEH